MTEKPKTCVTPEMLYKALWAQRARRPYNDVERAPTLLSDVHATGRFDLQALARDLNAELRDD